MNSSSIVFHYYSLHLLQFLFQINLHRPQPPASHLFEVIYRRYSKWLARIKSSSLMLLDLATSFNMHLSGVYAFTFSRELWEMFFESLWRFLNTFKIIHLHRMKKSLRAGFTLTCFHRHQWF
jgi:hypothetical protein